MVNALSGWWYAARRGVILSVMLLVAVMGLATPAHASAESSLASKINAERTSRGLAPLEIYFDLTDDARAHSQRMMDEDNLYHNPNLAGVTDGWYALGENVGVGPGIDVLHDAFMDSPGHRANVLGDYNYMGIGVVKESDTKYWVTVVFMLGPEGLVTPPDPEPDPDPAPPPPDEPPPADPEPEPAPEPEPEPEPAPVPQPAPAAKPKTKAAPAPAPKEEPPVHVVPEPRLGRNVMFFFI